MTATLNLVETLELSPDAQDLLFREARTANTYTDEPVTDEQLRAIYDLVKYAPTSMNNQPLRVVAVRSPEARAELVARMSEGNRAKTAAAPLTVILAADNHFHEEFHRTFPIKPNAHEMFQDAEVRERVALLNTSLQVGYFILGVRAAGLAAGPMTGFDADAVTEHFFPDGEHRALVVVNIGHPGPDAWFDRLPRLDYEDVVTTV